jgi:hypothetical protein
MFAGVLLWQLALPGGLVRGLPHWLSRPGGEIREGWLEGPGGRSPRRTPPAPARAVSGTPVTPSVAPARGRLGDGIRGDGIAEVTP